MRFGGLILKLKENNNNKNMRARKMDKRFDMY